MSPNRYAHAFVFAWAATLIVTTDASAQSLECGKALCAAINNAPIRAQSGSLVTFDVNYRYQAGEYPEGVRIHIDAPRYFVANSVPTNDTWQPYLLPPTGPAVPAVCTRLEANPWHVDCGVQRQPFTVSDNVNNGLITVAMFSQPFDTPQNYPATFTVTISGKRRFPIGSSTLEEVSHTATATVRMYGEANPYLAPVGIYGPYEFPVDEPDRAEKRARSEGLTIPYFNGYVWIQNLDDPTGPPIRARHFSLGHALSNIVPRPTAKNSSDFDPAMPYDPENGLIPGSGDLYSPALIEDEHFEIDLFRPTTGSLGSNALIDVRYEAQLPNWVRFGSLAASFAPGQPGMSHHTLPAYGAHGGLVGVTMNGPYGRAQPITAAVYPVMNNTLWTGVSMGTPSLNFYIPCDVDLNTIDTDRTKLGTQLPAGAELFEIFVHGKERRSVPDPARPGEWLLEEVDHTIEHVPYNALSSITLVDCPPPPALGIPNNGKSIHALPNGSNHTGSGGAVQWTNVFNPIANWAGNYGDFAIVDALPPFHEAGRFANWTGGTTPHAIAGAPWLCVLPRTTVIAPSFTGTCPDAAVTTHSPPQTTPWNTGNANCNAGAPLAFRYDPDGQFFDPLPARMDVVYDPANPSAGLAWNQATGQGCLRIADVCDHATTYRDYGTCTPGVGGKRAYAHQITHVLWRSDQDDSTAIGWPATTTALGLPAPPVGLSLVLQTWATPIDDPTLPYPLPTYEDRRVLWSLNSTRFFGGDFDPDGEGPIPLQRLGNGALTLPGTNPGSSVSGTYTTTVYALARTDNRWSMSASLSIASVTTARGTSVTFGTNAVVIPHSVNSPPPPMVGGVRAFIDLPPGVDPGWASPNTGNARRVTVAVPPNPVGLTGPLTESVSFDPARFIALAPPTEADLNTTLHWIGSPTDPNAGHWRYAFTLPDTYLSRGWANAGGTYGVYVTTSPRHDYPFVNLAPNTLTLTVTAPDFDRHNDNNFVTYAAGDEGDIVTITSNILVPMLAEVKVDAEPFCVPGRTSPSFMVRYHNVGGVDQYGAEVVFQVPESADGLPVVFAGIHEEVAWRPPGTQLHLEVSTTTRNATQLSPPPAWVALGTYAGPLADVKLVRIRFDDTVAPANRLPAWFANGRYRVDLATPSATVSHIGTAFSTTAFIGTRQNGIPVLPLASSLLSQPFLLGQCPARLVVTKFYDHDRDGTRDEADHVLPDWPIDLNVAAGQSLATGAFVDNGPKSGVTGEDGTIVFDVWPGQIPTVSEHLPTPSTVPVPDYPDTSATLSWTATTPGGAQRTLAALGFSDRFDVTFGNACACGTTNRCVATACQPPESGDGATCTFDYTGPATCDTPGMCGEASGYCDPASGQCAYPQVACESQPTRIYVVIDDTAGNPVGSVVCELDAELGTLECATRREGDAVVLDVQEVFVCAP